jgi:hypothetical protein
MNESHWNFCRIVEVFLQEHYGKIPGYLKCAPTLQPKSYHRPLVVTDYVKLAFMASRN